MASSLVGERTRTPVPKKQNRIYSESQTVVITRSPPIATIDFQWDTGRNNGTTDLPFLGMNLNLTMSSTAGMRNARVLPLPVFAAARRSLKNKKEKERDI